MYLQLIRCEEQITEQPLTEENTMLINMQLSHHLFRAGIQLTLRWRPRDGELQMDLTDGKMENLYASLQVVAHF